MGEFDPGGVLYHARYFHLLEEIREAYLVANHLPYSDLMKEGLHLPLVHAEQKFVAPVRYGMDLIGKIAIESVSKIRFTVFHQISHKDSILHLARTTLACVKETISKEENDHLNKTSFKVEPLPEPLVKILKQESTHEHY